MDYVSRLQEDSEGNNSNACSKDHSCVILAKTLADSVLTFRPEMSRKPNIDSVEVIIVNNSFTGLQ